MGGLVDAVRTPDQILLTRLRSRPLSSKRPRIRAGLSDGVPCRVPPRGEHRLFRKKTDDDDDDDDEQHLVHTPSPRAVSPIRAWLPFANSSQSSLRQPDDLPRTTRGLVCTSMRSSSSRTNGFCRTLAAWRPGTRRY